MIVESPFAGEIERNTAYARAALLDSLRRGEAPIASHLLHTQVLDDQNPEDRILGINAGLAQASSCDFAAFYVDLGWSRGMREAQRHYDMIGVNYVLRTMHTHPAGQKT